MSVINQVLQDLDARKTGRHGEDPVWAIEPPAIAEPPRRIPALTLTVPVVAIAVAALFGQGSWGWQTPDATARHSIGPTMAAGTADAAATTRGMIAGVPLPGSSASPGSAPGATPMTIAALRAFEPVDYLPDPSPRADGANRSTATAPDAASAAAAVPATAPIAPIPAVANVTNGGPALAWLTSPSPTDVPAASPTATAVASRSPSAASTTTTPVASTAALASLAPPAQVSTPHGPGAASRATMPAASTT
ncbi:MAG: hypothetical protein KAY46_19560, partial [Burkholderiaceae bacterium]|nr:hypothetical protein [Burkholderiaceae bacterium]